MVKVFKNAVHVCAPFFGKNALDCNLKIILKVIGPLHTLPVLGPRHQFPLGSPTFPLFLFYETTTASYDKRELLGHFYFFKETITNFHWETKL